MKFLVEWVLWKQFLMNTNINVSVCLEPAAHVWFNKLSILLLDLFKDEFVLFPEEWNGPLGVCLISCSINRSTHLIILAENLLWGRRFRPSTLFPSGLKFKSTSIRGFLEITTSSLPLPANLDKLGAYPDVWLVLLATSIEECYTFSWTERERLILHCCH